MTDTPTGQCLCGSVAFSLEKPISHVDACHCRMCQRWTGGLFIGADLTEGGVQFSRDDTLTWYESSEWAMRGFCSKCGSSMFYRLKDENSFWAVSVGVLDEAPDLALGKEIFIDEKPPLYALQGDHDRLTGEEFLATLNLSSDEAK